MCDVSEKSIYPSISCYSEIVWRLISLNDRWQLRELLWLDDILPKWNNVTIYANAEMVDKETQV